MDVVSGLLSVLTILNIILAIPVIFLERRDAGSTWAWLLVLFFIPLFGFILYLIFGQSLKRYKLFQWEDSGKTGLEPLLKKQLEDLNLGSFMFSSRSTFFHQDLIYMHVRGASAVLTEDNDIEIFTDGKEKFNRLLNDIRHAKKHIHIQYYIIKDDTIGRRLIELLTEKAREGLSVKILYDELGSRSLRRKVFHEFKAAGGQVEVFFPSKLKLINLRLNFRNHRKLVIIDGKIGYLGGFNIGDEYLGLDPKFGYWRDTHLRLAGSAVYAVQTRFILDWNQASRRHDIMYHESLYPKIESTGTTGMQIVSSGPDSEWEQIKNGYIKLILSARESILIQTPYFIPDASLLDALRIASVSGIKVSIMIPNKPDHMFVYWATLSYIGEMLKAGAEIYIYEKGFIHAKTIVVDGELSSVGTANIDVRSFKLNFEVNAFIYDEETARLLSKHYMEDIKVSSRLTLEAYEKRKLWIRIKESVSRLLSPIL